MTRAPLLVLTGMVAILATGCPEPRARSGTRAPSEVAVADKTTSTPASGAKSLTTADAAASAGGPAASGAQGESACLERLTVDRAGSVLTEQRQVGPELPDYQKELRAVAIDEATFLAVKAVAAHRLDGRALMWFPPDRRAAVVDARVFSDLTVADPTRMRPGEVATVGRLTETVRGRLPGRDLAKFLIQGGVIQTFWHIEAQLCLVSERDENGAYEAAFDGEHIYFTNSQNRDRYAFTLRIAADGTITVVGR